MCVQFLALNWILQRSCVLMIVRDVVAEIQRRLQRLRNSCAMHTMATSVGSKYGLDTFCLCVYLRWFFLNMKILKFHVRNPRIMSTINKMKYVNIDEIYFLLTQKRSWNLSSIYMAFMLSKLETILVSVAFESSDATHVEIPGSVMPFRKCDIHASVWLIRPTATDIRLFVGPVDCATATLHLSVSRAIQNTIIPGRRMTRAADRDSSRDFFSFM